MDPLSLLPQFLRVLVSSGRIKEVNNAEKPAKKREESDLEAKCLSLQDLE